MDFNDAFSSLKLFALVSNFLLLERFHFARQFIKFNYVSYPRKYIIFSSILQKIAINLFLIK